MPHTETCSIGHRCRVMAVSHPCTAACYWLSDPGYSALLMKMKNLTLTLDVPQEQTSQIKSALPWHWQQLHFFVCLSSVLQWHCICWEHKHTSHNVRWLDIMIPRGSHAYIFWSNCLKLLSWSHWTCECDILPLVRAPAKPKSVRIHILGSQIHSLDLKFTQSVHENCTLKSVVRSENTP